MSLRHGKADMTENSVKSLSSRGNDAVKADLIGTAFIDMQ